MISLWKLQRGLALVYILIALATFAAGPALTTALVAVAIAAFFYLTGKLLPDVDVPVSACPRVVGLGLAVAAIGLAIGLSEPASGRAWLVVAMAACAANRMKAGGIGA